jgi:hypothetical protein
MEEATGAPSSFADWDPKRLRASGRDGGGIVNRPPSSLTMLLLRHTKRREFITLIGGAAAWPLAARAQQDERMRRIGVLLPAAANDPRLQTFLAAFHQGLALLGWTVGRNVRIDTRWAAGHAEIRQHVQELVSLAPDVIPRPGGGRSPARHSRAGCRLPAPREHRSRAVGVLADTSDWSAGAISRS